MTHFPPPRACKGAALTKEGTTLPAILPWLEPGSNLNLASRPEWAIRSLPVGLGDRLQHHVQIGSGIPATPDHHPVDSPGVGNILQRIPIPKHQIGSLADLDGAEFIRLPEIQGRLLWCWSSKPHRRIGQRLPWLPARHAAKNLVSSPERGYLSLPSGATSLVQFCRQ